jgi:hypothetical protein
MSVGQQLRRNSPPCFLCGLIPWAGPQAGLEVQPSSMIYGIAESADLVKAALGWDFPVDSDLGEGGC